MATYEIGTCGYTGYDPGADWQDAYESKLQAYAADFPAVELNGPFYELPQVSTAERWHREATGGDADFTVALKAWQAITHPSRSPTWNGHRDAEPEGTKGYFRPTETVFEAWAATKARADALDADVVLLQTPPSFDATEEHVENLRAFVAEIERDGLTLAWEPRGDWKANLDAVADLCAELDLVHVTDLGRRFPVSTGQDVAYVRFHGLNDDPYDYEYDYGDAELDDLAARVEILGEEYETVYAMFNNYAKFANAQALRERLAGGE